MIAPRLWAGTRLVLPPRPALLAAVLYGALLLVLVGIIANTLGDLIASENALAEERRMQERLSRSLRPAAHGRSGTMGHRRCSWGRRLPSPAPISWSASRRP